MVTLKSRPHPGAKVHRRDRGNTKPNMYGVHAYLPKDHGTPAQPNGKDDASFLGTLWQAAGKFPFHAATLVSVPAVAIVLTLVGGLNLYRSLWTSLSMSDPVGAALSVLLALLVATYTLLATLTVSHMRGEIQRERRDAAADLAQKSIAIKQAEIDANVKELRQDAERSLELQHLITNRDRPNAMTRTNDEAPWSNFAPNSELVSIGGQMRLDAKIEHLPNGRRRYVVDQARIAKTTLPRFLPSSALRGATYILFVGAANNEDSSSVPSSVALHLSVFRTVRTLARQLGITPLLDRARFYLIAGSPAGTRITGEYLLNGHRVPFVNTYHDVGLMYGFESGIVDDRVLTSLHPEDVTNARRLADVLTANQVVYKLDDLEAKYGQLVDNADVNLVELTDVKGPLASLPEIIAFDDHFRFD